MSGVLNTIGNGFKDVSWGLLSSGAEVRWFG